VDEVTLAPRPVRRFADVLHDDQMARFDSVRARPRLAGRTVWHVESTAEGGGVAEMLTTAWEDLDRSWIAIIPPCIDVFSAKNQPLDDVTGAARRA
jgi:hypothetical protein